MALLPAYGRDYKSEEAVVKDYLAGKDFILADVSSKWNGAYCSCRDFPGQKVELRYKKMTRLVMVDTPA